ncbi:PLEIOTROPIC DRUG RESISTANCE PROTEIN 1-LIKE ISOFORM X1 [Salix viminalis]|uniref:PLEIOTROPIC DRUG RESISTANCE PROTEIN 1-LIKE ISOFORM X1 n=1 Tax=Salix viminalis TaxID=40686 RepID=A0A9Q0T879_SALVM|nr:PLEIOTROPIC DRUG RESISTANCE PROTEIN 1-LIKE ISOFORM X1 [Salix viminalis]
MIFVDEVTELVELDNLKDAIVGLPGITGLSTEQRKRLTIAVELVANPSIIFMDEPTSGLDARAAAIVMRTVRNTVDTGRTVVSPTPAKKHILDHHLAKLKIVYAA